MSRIFNIQNVFIKNFQFDSKKTSVHTKRWRFLSFPMVNHTALLLFEVFRLLPVNAQKVIKFTNNIANI